MNFINKVKKEVEKAGGLKKLPNYTKEVQKVIQCPISDEIIKEYLPEAKIIQYGDLKNYNYIEDLLSKNIDYAIILYPTESINNGHWVAILRYNNIIEYFDPYGEDVDNPLIKWLSCLERIKFNIPIPYLSRLLNNYKGNVVYNGFDFQQEKPNINTCGSHCIFRIINLLKHNYDLKQYYNLLVKLKQKYKINFDEIVATQINNR